MKIKDVFGFKGSVKGDVALEIELEGHDLIPIHSNTWETTTDGSLKNGGLEFVLSNPKTIPELRIALEELVSHFNKNKCKINKSIYAGTHLHVNVQHLSPKEVISFVCAFIVLEELLVDWCGEDRTGNHFCLRTCDAEWLISFIRSMIVNEDILSCKDNDEIRYSSINLKALGKYGSIEFRTLDSTLDIDRMMIWAEVLLNIRDQSITYPSPSEMLENISASGYNYFATQMLGEHASKFLKEGWEKKIRRGIIRAQEIAYAKNWNSINLNIFKTGVF